MKAKAVSPMIAVVLLIAFTVAVGGILSLWLSGLSGTTTATAGSATEKQVLCAGSLQVTEVTSAFVDPASVVAGDQFNVTIKYVSGSEPIYNFNVTLTDTIGNSLLVTPGLGRNFNKTTPFRPGQIHVFNITLNDTYSVVVRGDLTGTALSKATVAGKCQDTVPIIAACSKGDPCMK